MNKKKAFLIIQSLLCAAVTALLIAGVIGLFMEGSVLKAEKPLEWIFTRERAASALKPVLPLFLVSLVMTAAGLILQIQDEKSEMPVRDMEIQRKLLVSRVCGASPQMATEQARQKKLLYGGWALFALSMVPILLYVTNGTHFPNGDLEPVFLALIAHTLPWTAIGLAVLMITSKLREKSMLREIDAAKAQIREETFAGIRPEVQKADNAKDKKQPSRVRVLRAVLIVLAIALIAAGAYNGSARDVFGKAVKICTECVGLG